MVLHSREWTAAGQLGLQEVACQQLLAVGKEHGLSEVGNPGKVEEGPAHLPRGEGKGEERPLQLVPDAAFQKAGSQIKGLTRRRRDPTVGLQLTAVEWKQVRATK